MATIRARVSLVAYEQEFIVDACDKEEAIDAVCDQIVDDPTDVVDRLEFKIMDDSEFDEKEEE